MVAGSAPGSLELARKSRRFLVGVTEYPSDSVMVAAMQSPPLLMGILSLYGSTQPMLRVCRPLEVAHVMPALESSLIVFPAFLCPRLS